MRFGTEVSLGPGHTVLDIDPAPPYPSKKQGIAAPIFGPCLLWPNGRPSELLLSAEHLLEISTVLFVKIVTKFSYITCICGLLV